MLKLNLKNKSKPFLTAIAAFAAVSVLWTPSSTVSAELTDATVQSYEAQIADLTAKQQEAQKKIDEARKNQENEYQYKVALDESVELTARKITTAESMIGELEAKILENENLIAEKEQEIEDTHEKFLERTVAYYEDGNASYLSLLLGSEDLGEFLARLDRVSAILEYDNKIIEELNDAKAAIESSKAELEASKASQEATLQELESSKAYLETLSAESASALKSYEDSEQEWKEQYEYYTNMSNEFSNQLSAYLVELQAQSNKAYVGGEFMWPLPTSYTTISSHFGSRVLNGVPDYHAATDIPAPTGTPIYASNGGEVVKSEYHESYGNYVLITHGGGKATLYAHMSARYVSAGQTVSQGDTIGAVGNTGYSFGSHLHFEMQIDGQRVDAEPYVSMP